MILSKYRTSDRADGHQFRLTHPTKAAKKLDVQVFATTHSSDCWLSLATVASQDDAVKEGVSIQRIEPHKKQAVAFTEEEIIIAAERGIEVC